MKILFGYDGSECADAALIDLNRAGLPADIEILILTAADVFIPPESSENTDEEVFPMYVPHGIKLARERAAKLFADAEKTVKRAGKKVGEMFPSWNVKTEAVADTPNWAIIAKAEEWKPDLVVVGSQGRTALGRFVFGSVSQKVLYETTCSVRIARGRETSKEMPVKIVLGVDGSANSEAMIDVVRKRNWGKGTEAKIVTAVETIPQHAVDPERQMSEIRNIQESAMEKLASAGLQATSVITFEDPKNFVIREAEKWQADCIFLGAKGQSLWKRLTIGSVSAAVAARAHCSVEVIRINVSTR